MVYIRLNVLFIHVYVGILKNKRENPIQSRWFKQCCMFTGVCFQNGNTMN